MSFLRSKYLLAVLSAAVTGYLVAVTFMAFSRWERGTPAPADAWLLVAGASAFLAISTARSTALALRRKPAAPEPAPLRTIKPEVRVTADVGAVDAGLRSAIEKLEVAFGAGKVPSTLTATEAACLLGSARHTLDALTRADEGGAK